MAWFLTAYPVADLPNVAGGAQFGDDIFAKDHRDAVRICRERHIGERVISGPMARPTCHALVSDQLANGASKRKDVLHNAIFMCWVAMRCGVITVDEALGDSGLVHRFMHEGAPKASLIQQALEIEALIPGWRAPAKRSLPKPKRPRA